MEESLYVEIIEVVYFHRRRLRVTVAIPILSLSVLCVGAVFSLTAVEFRTLIYLCWGGIYLAHKE